MILSKNTRKIVLSFMLTLVLLVGACAETEPSRWDPAQKESTSRPSNPAVKQQVKGGEFNKFFPKPTGEFSLVYEQEKLGTAIADLKKGGQSIATLSITDIIDTPDAVKKFETSTKQIGGYPAAEQGKTMTSVLVADRFQVKVQSSSLSPSEREKWILEFNLSGLSRLK